MIVYTQPRRANSRSRFPRANRGLASRGILRSATSSLSNHPSGVLSCAKAQKHLSASPLFATLTDSLSRKSFPCHSYANTGDVGHSRYKFALRFSTGHRSRVTSHVLSCACALFISLCALFRAPILCFQSFADSFAKTPGVGVEHLFAPSFRCSRQRWFRRDETQREKEKKEVGV